MTMLNLHVISNEQSTSDSKLNKHQSYRCLIEGQERFLLEHYRRLNVMQESEIIDLEDSHNSLHIVQHHKAGRELVEINSLSEHTSWQLRDTQLIDTEGHCIAVYRHTGKQFSNLLFNISQLEALDTIVTDAHLQRVLLAMFKAPPQPQDPLNKVVSLFKHKEQLNECLRIKLLGWNQSYSLALALVLIHLSRGDS
ncbi:hypothetical protein [Agaribacterium sp. ZY112]|uniref:hypothetical protein n=1 Tax=Agaribacterium sp. ZY112 TaxID=3233574 RepID=UPI00352692BE